MPPTAVNIDDMDQSISYNGAWQEVEGSTRQWGGGTVHSTTQKGASASISFSGTRIRMYVTLYHGLGNEIANINFNGQTTTVSMPSQPTDVYNDVWFDSGELPSARYTFVVSNGGGSSDTPFQLDRFNIEGLVETPASASAPASPTAASPSSSPTLAPQPGTQATTQPTPVPSSSEDDSSAGAGRLLVSSISLTNAGGTSTPTVSGSPTTGAITALGQTTVVSIKSVQDITTTSIDAGGSPTQVANSAGPHLVQTASRKAPMGGIIGGAIGGSLFLLTLILLFLFLRRRKAPNRHVRLADEGVDDRCKSPTAVTPFRLDTRSVSSHSLICQAPDTFSAESRASSVVVGGYSGSITAHGRRLSIEKLPSSSWSQPLYPLSASSHGTMITTSAIGSPSRGMPSYVPNGLDQRSAGVGSHIARHQSTGDGISTSASSSFPMPTPDNTDTARPPSYHLSQALEAM